MWSKHLTSIPTLFFGPQIFHLQYFQLKNMSGSKESDEGKQSSSKTMDEMDDDLPPADLKVILLGDSAVGKSKLVERFLMGDYHPRQLSTYGK